MKQNRNTGWHEVTGINIEEMKSQAEVAEKKYGDLLRLSRPVSRKHKPMSAWSRAAQFSPFAALTGYDDMIEESGRLTDRTPELTQDDYEKLDIILSAVMHKDEKDRLVKISYFIYDELKEGGRCESMTGTIKRIDQAERVIIMNDGRRASLDMVVDIEPLDNSGYM